MRIAGGRTRGLMASGINLTAFLPISGYCPAIEIRSFFTLALPTTVRPSPPITKRGFTYISANSYRTGCS